MSLKCMPQELQTILKRDGFIIFINGAKEKGKTNLALLLAEICYTMDWRKDIATNITTESYMIKQITNFPDLKTWLMKGKKKLYILDEAGKHIKKMRFMSEKNLKFFEVLQLIRHYDCGFVGIAPSQRFIDSSFLDNDILDANINKITQQRAKVKDYLINSTYFWNDVPITSVKYNSKDIADFQMEKKIPLEELPRCCQAAQLYAQMGKYTAVAETLNAHPEEVRRLLIQHCKHTASHFTSNLEVVPNMKPSTPSN